MASKNNNNNNLNSQQQYHHVPQQQPNHTPQQQQAVMAHSAIMPQANGIINNTIPSQTPILLSPMMAAKNNLNQPQYLHAPPPQQPLQHSIQVQQQQQQQPQPLQQQQQQYQHQFLQQQQQLLAPQTTPIMNSQPPPPQIIQQQQQQQPMQQVPITTVMIPATAAAHIQSASIQIQQAAMQAMANNPGQPPQILVFMIPYMVSQPLQQQQQQHQQQYPQNQQQAQLHIQPPTIPPTPEQGSLNSTLVRQSQSTSIIRANQQQQQQQQQQPVSVSHSRALSSLSNAKQHESEKFYIKANFSFMATRNKMELSFQKGDILHVLDMLQNSDYGLQYWLATRVKSNGRDAEKGLIPDSNKAEEIALEQRTLEIGESSNGTLEGSGGSGSVLSASVGRVNFLRRRSAQRSKSLCKDNWDNVVFDIGSFKLPVYERVVFKHPGFCRPVVIFGPLADVAREKLLKDYPEKYSYPTGFHQSQDHPKVIRLNGIIEVVDQGKHALLDITPAGVEKLNYVNLAPIVIFMKTDSKSIIKEFRSRAAKSLDPNARDEDTLRRDGKSSRKLLEHSIKLEKSWFHVFTATLNLSTMGSEMWYRKLRETIENQQSLNVWMGERKSDKKITSVNNVNELLFPMPNIQSPSSSSSCMHNPNNISERFRDGLNITSKSTIDLLPDGTYGNRSQLRNAYAHSLAQKLARASSEPKLNGLMSENDEDDDDEDDDEDVDDNDDIIKKPFPEFENSSSVSSSNGATSYGQSSMNGASNLTYQHYPPAPTKPDPTLTLNNSRVVQSESIYSRNPSTMINSSSSSSNNINSNNNNLHNNSNSYSNGTSSTNSNYHPLPPHISSNENGYHKQSMNSINNNVIDLSQNHDTRGSAFQVYSDMNQNNYHYYNLN